MVRRRLLVPILTIAFIVPALAADQERRRAAAGPPPVYDVAAERTIAATAGESRLMEDTRAMRILTVTVEGRALQLILAPDAYLTQQGFAVAPGTALTVTGMPGARVNGEPAMPVREVKTAAKTWTLRDRAGKAVWEQR